MVTLTRAGQRNLPPRKVIKPGLRVIREADPSDAMNLAALSVQVWLHTYAKRGIRNALSRYVLAEFTPERMAASMADPEQVFLVFEQNAHLVGYVRIGLNSPCPSSENCRAEIMTLYVQEHFTGQGVGEALLSAAFKHCAAAGLDSLWLSVNHQNDRAIRFYEKHRFERCGTVFFRLEDEERENHVLRAPTGGVSSGQEPA